MTIFSFLYQLLIGPLELLFEVIFFQADRVIENPGFSIIVLSLIMNLLVLPLYKRADAMQEAQRNVEARLEPGVRHIRRTFQGDERYMMLQTYYRQNHYKPTYALRGSMSLLLEIPFFMAAYNMLSSLNVLHGLPFGPIADLGAPDGLLVIGGVAINVLPILMTLINGITSVLYTRGFPRKAKLQLYLMALLFLILLYDSPSGLVFYWTLNNVFSLVKTIFYKLKNPRLAAAGIASGVGLAGLIFINFFYEMPTARSRIMGSAVLLLLQLPLIIYWLLKKFPLPAVEKIAKKDQKIFYLSCLFMTLLTGLLIPSAVLKTSPDEFINLATFTDPMLYLLSSLALAAGTFLVWFGIFYSLASPGGKKTMGLLMLAVSGICLMNYLLFGTDLGMLTDTLQLENAPEFPLSTQIINLLAAAALGALLLLLYRKKDGLVRTISMTLCLVTVVMSGMNAFDIHKNLKGTIENLRDPLRAEIALPLSRNGKNVVLVMMDRAISGYLPYLFAEKPELREQFEGFTYYPNTLSFGPCTNAGSPALYGGYEYTPEEMNRRDQELLKDKHNEALKVMPVSFLNQGYKVTVCDASYANYKYIPDLSIYDDYPQISTYLTMRPSPDKIEAQGLEKERQMNRNFFCYSLFKTAPVLLQSNLYSEGYYNDMNALYPEEAGGQTQVIQGTTRATGYRVPFMEAYEALKKYPEMTKVEDTEENTFLLITNDTTHEPMLLQEPAYEPVPVVDNTAYEAEHADRFVVDGRRMIMDADYQVTHYQVNMAGMLQLGKWLDFLRQQQVFDNTRIIIVADHGSGLGQFQDMIHGPDTDEYIDTMKFNPLLLIKDFDSREFTVDDQFMTLGDIPSLAFQGLIEDPVNPFTGKAINMEPKQGPQHVMDCQEWNVLINNGTTFLPCPWYSVHDDMKNMDNWSHIPIPSIS